MPRVQRSALLPYRTADVFGIVNDVRRYPEFLPWCAAARVLEEGEHEVVAELALVASGLRESFTTRNRLQPFEVIELSLVEGPFSHLAGRWTFLPVGGDQGCRVTLDLSFRFAGVRALLGGVFSRSADQMVDAFCARAAVLLGER